MKATSTFTAQCGTFAGVPLAVLRATSRGLPKITPRVTIPESAAVHRDDKVLTGCFFAVHGVIRESAQEKSTFTK